MKLAVLFDNFGPYHVARLNAAARVAETLGVEFAAQSGEYAWAREAREEKFRRATLFDGGASRECSGAALVARLEAALADFAPDAVAVPGWSGRFSFAALSWCVRHGVPAIAMSESTADDGVRSRWKESIKRRCVGVCAAGLAGGQRHRDYLVQLGMPSERVFLGYDAVDNEHFARGAAEAARHAAERRAQRGLPEKFFLASARFVAKKNLPALVQAYGRYRAGVDEPWDLVILGDGELRAEVERVRESLGLNGHVHLPGFQQYNELPTYYGLAGAFIHASTVEQWGLVVNEAMAAGLPVLVSRRCGCADTLVQEGANGATFDPNAVDQMAEAMRRVSGLPETARAAMGEASRTIVADFGPERFAAGLMQAAEAATRAPGSRRRLGDSLLLGALMASSR